MRLKGAATSIFLTWPTGLTPGSSRNGSSGSDTGVRPRCPARRRSPARRRGLLQTPGQIGSSPVASHADIVSFDQIPPLKPWHKMFGIGHGDLRVTPLQVANTLRPWPARACTAPPVPAPAPAAGGERGSADLARDHRRGLRRHARGGQRAGRHGVRLLQRQRADAHEASGSTARPAQRKTPKTHGLPATPRTGGRPGSPSPWSSRGASTAAVTPVRWGGRSSIVRRGRIPGQLTEESSSSKQEPCEATKPRSHHKEIFAGVGSPARTPRRTSKNFSLSGQRMRPSCGMGSSILCRKRDNAAHPAPSTRPQARASRRSGR